MTDIAARVLTIFSTFAGLGFFGCLTMGIKEYDKRQTIMPLKITAAICLIYTEIFSLFVALNVINEYDKSIERFGILAGFAGLIWFTAAIIAFFISRGVRKRKIEAANKALIEKGRAAMEEKDTSEKSKAPKTDAELRAEIEEKVRREMIEKEVRERIAKEMSEKK